MTAADNSNVVQFANAADAIGDLVERLVDANVRLQQLEAMAADGENPLMEIVDRIDKLEARMTLIEKGRFKVSGRFARQQDAEGRLRRLSGGRGAGRRIAF
jgi:hypothetical protein